MKKGIIILIVLMLVGGLVWYFSTFYESYQKEFNTGYSSEARKNPFLAAKLFLQENKVNYKEKIDKLDFADIGVHETVFLASVDDMVLSQSQVDASLEWISSGGNLIVGVGKEIEGNTSLLEYFDVDPIEYTFDFEDELISDGRTVSERLRDRNKEIEEQQEDSEVDKSKEASSLEGTINDILDIDYETNTFVVEINKDIGEFTLQVEDEIVLNHPQAQASIESGDEIFNDIFDDDYSLEFYAGDKRGARLLMFNYGQGKFTVLSSAEYWYNYNIDSQDHAYLLNVLIPENSSVHFFYDISSLSLTQLLKKYFGESLLAALFLIILWLWRASLRTQVVKQELTNQRRAFSEHLKASAEFLSSKQQYSLLLEPIEADINAQMKILHPGYSDLSTDKQISKLSLQTEFAKETIESWFAALNNVENQEHMITSLQIGNAIRNKL